MPIIEGAIGAPLQSAGAPGAGTNEVQTITFGGTPTGGTFTLSFDGLTTAAISWSATNGTLVSNIDAALEALTNIGTGGVTTAVGTMTAGIGTITVTFAGGDVAKTAVSTLGSSSALTGTAPTLAVTETTPGVTQYGKGSPKGSLATDTTNGKLYINTGTAASPTWTVVGTQT
ncbi:MAG: hypothetical protein ABIR11_07105 [Candidatus Limnocylindrales bacterium]